MAFLKKRFGIQVRYSLRLTVSHEPTSYIDSLPLANQQEPEGSCVVVDLGRKDLLYYVHEGSTSQERMLYMYTKLQ